MMTPILTKSSLKMNYTPLLRGDTHETPWKCLRKAHALREYSSLSENSWSEWVPSYLRATVKVIIARAVPKNQ